MLKTLGVSPCHHYSMVDTWSSAFLRNETLMLVAARKFKTYTKLADAGWKSAGIPSGYVKMAIV